MSENNLVYSIQRTYNLKLVSTPGNKIITCDERIDIPTIEPLPNVQPVIYDRQSLTVIPCIELAWEFLAELNLTFVTNEGVTVLPVEIKPGSDDTLENPYRNSRYVLVLPRGTTGIKSCKLITKGGDGEVQHNFTFGIMPPPYNYDNALFGYLSYRVNDNRARITALEKSTSHYGYATQNGSHTIDFSNAGTSFIIKPDTRFLTFIVTNPLETATNMSIVLSSKRDVAKKVISACKVSPGQNNVKVDLQCLAVFIQNDNANKADSYIIPPMEDRSYEGIIFGYNRNANLPGSVEVREWA